MNNNDYYVGFDIGTDSIGMAVTDTSYQLLKYKGKSMWFVKLFDASMTAEEREKGSSIFSKAEGKQFVWGRQNS